MSGKREETAAPKERECQAVGDATQKLQGGRCLNYQSSDCKSLMLLMVPHLLPDEEDRIAVLKAVIRNGAAVVELLSGGN